MSAGYAFRRLSVEGERPNTRTKLRRMGSHLEKVSVVFVAYISWVIVLWEARGANIDSCAIPIPGCLFNLLQILTRCRNHCRIVFSQAVIEKLICIRTPIR